MRTNDYDAVPGQARPPASTDRHRISVRYNFLDSEALNFPGGGGRASPASTAARDNADHGPSRWWSNAVVDPLPAPRQRDPGAVGPAHLRLPAIVTEPTLEITNLIIMGKTTSDMDFYRETRWQATDSLLVTAGDHQFKVGVDVNFIEDEAGWNLFFPARIIFPNLTAFLSFTPVVFWWPSLHGRPHPARATTRPGTRRCPPPGRTTPLFDESHSVFGLFAQDQWRAISKLTLTYGLRYDLESYPEPYIPKQDTNNFQPRVGFAYAYSPRGVVRAGFGIFTDRLVSSVGQVFTASGWSSRGDLPSAQILFPGVAPVHGRFCQTTVGGPAAPAAALAFLTTGRVPAATGTSLTDNMRREHDEPLQLPGQRAGLPGDRQGVAVSASYLYVGARDVPIHGDNLNAVQTGTRRPASRSSRDGAIRASWATSTSPTNQGFSTYHGGTLEAARSASAARSGSTRATPTPAPDRGAIPSPTWPTSRQGTDGSAEDAFSRQHVPPSRHLVVREPGARPTWPCWATSSSPPWSPLESGRRFTEFAGSDANGDGNPNADRVGLVDRNTLEGPAYAQRRTCAWRASSAGRPRRGPRSASTSSTSSTGTNVRDLNTVCGSFDPNATPIAAVGTTPRDVFNPRQAQLGLKLRFWADDRSGPWASEQGRPWRLPRPFDRFRRAKPRRPAGHRRRRHEPLPGARGRALRRPQHARRVRRAGDGLHRVRGGPGVEPVRRPAGRAAERGAVRHGRGLAVRRALGGPVRPPRDHPALPGRDHRWACSASALAQGPTQLAALRVLTGIGVGGILASLNVITSEYSSRRWRSTAISLQVTGYPIGATLGRDDRGALLITSYGWRSAFLFGAAASAAHDPGGDPQPAGVARLPAGAASPGRPRRGSTTCCAAWAGPEVVGAARPARGRARGQQSGAPAVRGRRRPLHPARSGPRSSCVMFSFYFVTSWTPKLLVAAGLSTRQGITRRRAAQPGRHRGGLALRLSRHVTLLAPPARVGLYLGLTAGAWCCSDSSPPT